MIGYRASWVVPVGGPPLRDGWVVVADDRVVAVGTDRRRLISAGEWREVDLGGAAIMPGLVNAHTHLELSYLRGRVPPRSTFVAWVRALLAERRRNPDVTTQEILDGIARGIADAVRSGTAVVADISNTLATFALLAESPLAAAVFLELIGFNTRDPAGLVERARERLNTLPTTGRIRASVAAHAPYSVAPLVFRAIAQAVEHHLIESSSTHLAESVEELEFVRTGRGPWRDLLEELGAWDAAWVAPGVSPVRYLDDSGFLGTRTLAVHGVQMTPDDLAVLASRRATLVTCPRSNAYTGAGTPPIEKFYHSGVRVAVGTDSLASAPDLNVFAELAAMRSLAPSVPARLLLGSATIVGAQALGFDEYGVIEPGKRARLIAVDVPSGVDDVEEYLVAGIQPVQIRWVEP